MLEKSLDYFKKMIEGKRIVLVGPAEYVMKELGNDHGKYIDSFDIVIKMNGMIKLPHKELEKFYGKRLDVLMSTCWYTHERDYLFNKNVYGDKYFKCERYNSFHLYNDCSNTRIIRFLIQEELHIKPYDLLVNLYKELYSYPRYI